MNAIKSTFLGICLVAASSVMYAQGMHSTHNKVPNSVTERFHKDYPDANKTNWSYTNGKWNADFRRTGNNEKMMACYNEKGHRLDSRISVAETSVPSKVRARIHDKYPGDYAHNYRKIDRPWKGDLYQVRVKEHGVYKTQYFDKRGHERDYASR